MTSTTFRLEAAPRLAHMMEWDCAQCGRVEVKPVFLSQNGGNPVAYGTTCAARLLGYLDGSSKARNIRCQAESLARLEADLEADRAERRTRYGAALAAFTAEDDGNVNLVSARRNYHVGGGNARFGLFPAFMAEVANTGNIPA